MSTDAYSPITGRWQVEGLWDVVFLGLAIAALALLVLLVSRTRSARAVALVALLVLVPAYVGVGWLNDTFVRGHDGERIYCLLDGPVDAGTRCGAAYLRRYTVLVLPLVLLLLTLVWVLALQVHRRIWRRGKRTATV